jgi:hypothetical protein
MLISVIFTKNKIYSNYTYHINGKALKEVEDTLDLGVTLDKKLRFHKHIDNIVSKAFRMLGFVIRNCKELKPSTKILLYNAYVRSTLDYCSPVWSPHYEVHTKRLEGV